MVQEHAWLRSMVQVRIVSKGLSTDDGSSKGLSHNYGLSEGLQ